MLVLNDFSLTRPPYELEQSRSLSWLAEAHTVAQATSQKLSPSEQRAFGERMRKLLAKCACGPEKVGHRGYCLADFGSSAWREHSLYDVTRYPHGQGTAVRSRLFRELVDQYFEREYAALSAPSALIHVTCTGYVAPSGAQRLVAAKQWGERTHVTHAYHMGCYAAFPALEIAAGHLSVPTSLSPSASPRRADIVHTELCTLHLDPDDHSAEQCVVQSLFSDGFIRYSVHSDSSMPGLALVALSQQVLPECESSMSWTAADYGMHMTLARDVPKRVADALRAFVARLLAKADLNLSTLKDAIVAVHPGGPKIIDSVRETLELREAQVETSRQVLFDYGNMSSATLPHVWQRILADDRVRAGTWVVSLAFGPGLTLCGGVFQKL